MTAPDDVRARFDAELAKLPAGAQANIRDAMSRGESLSFSMFEAGYRAAHADLSGEVRELKLVIEGLSQYSHNAQEVRELVEAVVTHWMDDRGLVITSEFRNDPKSSSDYRAAYCIPCVKKGRKIVPVLALAKFRPTHQEKP